MIPSLDQIARGQSGGRTVAAKLTEAIRQYLPTDQFQLHVLFFLNKHGFLETLRKLSKEEARSNFNNFAQGFNQAAERFLMVDVGYGKEAVDAKLRAYLEDEVKALQTIKVILGGCHDNGYMATLRSIITSGYESKLILLSGYQTMAAQVQSLGLPQLRVPDLFEPEKLCPNTSPVLSSVVPATPPGLRREGSKGTTLGYNVAAMNGTSTSQRTQLRPTQSGGHTMWRSSGPPSPPRSRHIDPTKSLSKQDPPPCNVFYLTQGCKHGSTCVFAHNYLMKPEYMEEMRENAKKSPCASLNRGETCPYGSKCCYGHKCQSGLRCHFYKLGICKFVGVGMHAD
ncbi:hypothetical protein K474DRAFT_149240 [Panus rudis PR-1116 ss-1]|nr:hypothetical protein K474DRAFT_149240 [Panus rudis PR-1116 ss-1]